MSTICSGLPGSRLAATHARQRLGRTAAHDARDDVQDLTSVSQQTIRSWLRARQRRDSITQRARDRLANHQPRRALTIETKKPPDARRRDHRELGTLDRIQHAGHTSGMKAAVSIPDEVFQEADRLARELKTSRSQLYSRALKEFLARHAPDQVTEAMNRVCDEVGKAPDELRRRVARRVLEKVEW